jgi:hypothetical protein
MVGYNHRATLIRFSDDDDGYGVAEFTFVFFIIYLV